MQSRAVGRHARVPQRSARLPCRSAPQTPGWSPLANQNTQFDPEDPEWSSKVTDWAEFWNHAVWDEEALRAESQEPTSAPDSGQGDRKSTAMRRMEALIEALPDLEQRDEVIQYLMHPRRHQHFNAWERPPAPEKTHDVTKLTDFDLRAMMEKRRKKAALDAEWQRRKAAIGRFKYATSGGIYHDARIASNSYEPKATWSEDEVWALITNNGVNADLRSTPQIVQVLNPLAAADWVNDHGVRYIEETEDFLRRIGHLVDADDDPTRTFDFDLVVKQSDLGGLGVDERVWESSHPEAYDSLTSDKDAGYHY